MKRSVLFFGLILSAASGAAQGLFSSAKYTPEIHFDMTGSEPVVTLRTKDGTGKIREIPVDNGEVRLIPGTKFKVFAWTSGVRPNRASSGATIKITRNRISTQDGLKKEGNDGVDRGPASAATTGTGAASAGGTGTTAAGAAGQATNPPGAGRAQPGTQQSRSLLIPDRNEGTQPAAATPNDQLMADDPSLRVLPEGSVYLEVTGNEKTATLRVLPAEKWDFKDAFEPFFSITHGSSLEFSAVTKFKTLGFNNNLRLDSVAVLSPGQNGKDGEAFLGVGLSYSNFIGSQFKGSGKPFFGFPVRWTATLGLKGLSFEKHTKGEGTPFFGIGIQIPIGG